MAITMIKSLLSGYYNGIANTSPSACEFALAASPVLPPLCIGTHHSISQLELVPLCFWRHTNVMAAVVRHVGAPDDIDGEANESVLNRTNNPRYFPFEVTGCPFVHAYEPVLQWNPLASLHINTAR